MVKNIIEREGGSKITRDPDDPGGTTRFGISQRAHKDVDIENLTYDKASDIYYEHYYKPAKTGSFPIDLQEIYLDMVVNMGYSRAVKVVQRAVNAKGADLIVDGKLGPKTLGAVRDKNLEPERLTAYRVVYYVELCKKRPSMWKYYFGWYRRSTEV
jgi:lysozyme family protein|tara:strand:+ start:1462 stop:1929 length:468 start_codon:yes stop_codon:yes gene_type:complete